MLCNNVSEGSFSKTRRSVEKCHSLLRTTFYIPLLDHL